MNKLKDAIRFFSLSMLTMVVIAAAFLGFRSQMKNELLKNTFQRLTEAAQQQAVTIREFFEVTEKRMLIIAKYGSDIEHRAIVERMLGELTGGQGMAWAALVDLDGNLKLDNGTTRNVSGEDWFQTCLAGETVIAVGRAGELTPNGILVAVPIQEGGLTVGALVARMDRETISGLTQTSAFQGYTYALLSDAVGDVFAVADQTTQETYTFNLFDEFVNDAALQGDMTEAKLRASFQNGETTSTTTLRGGKIYYSVNVPIGIANWYFVLAVPGSVADELSTKIITYVLVMLFLVILVHTSVIFEAYRHEKDAVCVLERDKELLRQSSELYTMVNRLSNEVLFTVDMEDGRIRFNDCFEAMFGMPAPSCSLDHIEDCYQMVFEPDRPVFTRFIEHMNAGAPQAHEELRMKSARGVVRWKHLEIYTVFDSEGRSRQVVGKITDIHRQKQSLQRLRKKADSDPLTGLLNRGAMEQYTKAFLQGEGKEDIHAFLILDFDNFKQVNDTLGHSEGDRMLIEFAHAVNRLFRAGDLIARLGGDEYTMFMKGIDSDQNALEKGDQVRGAMTSISAAFGVPVTVSVGIAIYNRDGSTFEALYKAADSALYRVKKSGKNACALFSEPEPTESTETEDQDNGKDHA
ncbi:MAG TPA: diguanylate cyclase [Candidatus Cryosericum sp.]|nr:diguanylate cyclase [Candidatus Cryosericum sp.]